MKKKLLYLAAVLICLSLMTGGTLAYFTAEDTARNVITTGGVQVTVVEQQLVNGQLMPYPDGPVCVMPGARVSKIVSVRNAQEDAWVRMNYEIIVYDAQGERMQIPQETLKTVIRIDHDETNWTLVGDWWYYNSALEEGQITEPLFQSVDFSGPDMGNEYQNATVEILVTAQAVQLANNGSTPAQAAGWPEE